MAVSTDSTTRLGCGRDIDDVWASIDQDPSPHERQCPYCQQARASLGRLSQAIAAQRRADSADPDLQPDPQVLGRVMEIARAEIRRGRRLPLDEPVADGTVSDLSVSEQTVAAVVRRAGDAVAGVEVRRCRVELGDPRKGGGEPASETGAEPAPSVEVPESYRTTRPARVTVAVQISVSATVAIPEISERIRESVGRAVSEEVGMNVVIVDIDVRDVHDA